MWFLDYNDFEPENLYYDNESSVCLPRHCNGVTRESAVVWAKTGETLAVGTVGDYGLDY